MRNSFAKFINSFAGMTIWMFAMQFAMCAFIFEYSFLYSLTFSSTMALFLAFQFTRKTKKDTPFFAKNVKENKFDLMRRFKKYVQKGELPTNKDEYSDFMEYLEEADGNHAKKPLKQEKIIVGILGALGVFVVAADSVLTGVLFIAMTVFFALQIRSSAKARKMVPLLKEKLHNTIKTATTAS